MSRYIPIPSELSHVTEFRTESCKMSNAIFDRFCSQSTMMNAEIELSQLGAGAIPALEALFSGEAKNEWGIPYRKFGLPLTCAYAVASRLGPAAKPLERHLRDGIQAGDRMAAVALGSLESLDDVSVSVLAEGLQGGVDLSYECAEAILRCNVGNHAAVMRATSESPKAQLSLQRVAAYLAKRA